MAAVNFTNSSRNVCCSCTFNERCSLPITARSVSSAASRYTCGNAKEQVLPEGSRLVLTGHSQGGMIAQQLAADPEIRRRFEVLHTVTVGSPPIAVGAREGQTRRVVAVGDPVALASPLGPLAALARRGADTAQTAFLNPIDTHRFAYTDETRDLGQRDALGGRGTARLEFDPAERRFVSSPSR